MFKISILLFALLCSALRGAAAPVAFTNATVVNIPSTTNLPSKATPYPSTITVSGLSGQIIAKVTVTIRGFMHTFPSDVALLLVSPSAQRALLMAEVGGQNRDSVTNVTLMLDDAAAASLPVFTTLTSGAFQPTDGWLDPYFDDPSGSLPYDFPPPAPAGSSNSPAALSVFNGTSPNGTWTLFALGASYPDLGAISNGWSLAISAIPLVLNIEQSDTNAVLSWTNLASGFTLQTTPAVSLTGPSTWTNAVPAPVVVSGRFTVTNPIAGATRFYRLSK
jgi:hypothetical protein